VRRKWRALALVLTVTVYFAAVHIVFFISPKSLMPGSLGYIILDAIALNYIYGKIKLSKAIPGRESVKPAS
jgi:hypothetical protein